MQQFKLTDSELKFAEIIWQNEPMGSGELVKQCEAQFNWKKSTTYTVLKNLCERGILKNEQAVVTSLISRVQYHQHRSQQFVEDTFGGSLPNFLTAFMGGKKLSSDQANQLKKLIDDYEEE